MLENDELLLRPFVPEDAPYLFALNEDPTVLRYVPDEPFENEEAARKFLHSYLASQPNGYGRMAVIRKSDQAWLGWCGLKYHDNGMVDLGYRFFRRYWGQGYATESAMLSIQHGFEVLGLQEIVGHVAKDNAASIRVLEKCGFQCVGTFQDPDWSGLLYHLAH